MNESREHLKELIEVLQESLRWGFGSRPSPIYVFLDVMVDLSLRIANQLEDIPELVTQLNPELKMPPGEVDELNNPKMIWIGKSMTFKPKDPKYLPRFFRALASELIRLKRNPSFRPFMGRWEVQQEKMNPEEFHYHNRKARLRKK